MPIVCKSEILASDDCIADSKRNKGELLCSSQSVHDYLCVCDVSIEGRGPDHEVNVWSLSDIYYSVWLDTFIVNSILREISLSYRC